MGNESVSSEGENEKMFQAGAINVRSEVPKSGRHLTYWKPKEVQSGGSMVMEGEPGG